MTEAQKRYKQKPEVRAKNKDYLKNYRIKNHERCLKYAEKWRADNQEKVKENNRRNNDKRKNTYLFLVQRAAGRLKEFEKSRIKKAERRYYQADEACKVIKQMAICWIERRNTP